MGKLVSREELVTLRQEARRQGHKVVFTNGCFDLLHRGHVEYLSQAKKLGDILVVGLNSDHSVQKLKGQGRPLTPQEDRARVLTALEMVDYVCIFEEETPALLIQAVVPDVLVKGSDYKLDEIVGRDTVEEAGGRVVSVPLVEGFSTRALIQKILQRYG
jgi:rfaE bifunctional protein nucleotidyltransferase chain/domain